MVKERIVEIDGSAEFPFDSFGLEKDSIRRKDGYIMIPAELLPYLRLCLTPLRLRILKAASMYRYRKNLQKHDESKSPKKGR